MKENGLLVFLHSRCDARETSVVFIARDAGISQFALKIAVGVGWPAADMMRQFGGLSPSRPALVLHLCDLVHMDREGSVCTCCASCLTALGCSGTVGPLEHQSDLRLATRGHGGIQEVMHGFKCHIYIYIYIYIYACRRVIFGTTFCLTKSQERYHIK